MIGGVPTKSRAASIVKSARVQLAIAKSSVPKPKAPRPSMNDLEDAINAFSLGSVSTTTRPLIEQPWSSEITIDLLINGTRKETFDLQLYMDMYDFLLKCQGTTKKEIVQTFTMIWLSMSNYFIRNTINATFKEYTLKDGTVYPRHYYANMIRRFYFNENDNTKLVFKRFIRFTLMLTTDFNKGIRKVPKGSVKSVFSRSNMLPKF